jgi:hypothetical protein
MRNSFLFGKSVEYLDIAPGVRGNTDLPALGAGESFAQYQAPQVSDLQR